MDSSMLLNDVDKHDGTTYAEPLAGLRVSWGAILAGAVALVAVSVILWSLSAAITLTATNATVGSIKGSMIALWVCAIVTTLIGAFAGGWLAGYLPGNKSILMGGAHGGIAWAAAFVVMTALTLTTLGSLGRTASEVTATAAGATVQSAGAAVGGVAGGTMPLDAKALNLLTSLGYTPAEAASMVSDAKGAIQGVLRGRVGVAPGADARGMANGMINLVAGLTWSWFGTWFVAALLAIGGGILAANQLQPKVGARARPVQEPPRTVPEVQPA